MIISILDPRDLRRPRLAFAIAQARCIQTRSLALLDATAASCSQWRSQPLAASSRSPKLTVIPAAGRCLQPALNALGSRCRDIVIDIDETESFAARSAMVAAKVLVVATTSVENDDYRGDYEDVSRSLLALRDRIERARLFNPTLKVLLALVDRTSPRADRQRDALQRLAHLIPSARVAHCSLANPGRLCALSHGRLDADMERDIAALCAEIFQDSNRPLPRAPQSLRSLRPSSGKAAETGRRSFINPAGRAGTPPPFR